MAVQHNERQERKSREEYFALLESDSEDLYVELSDNYRICPDVTVSCDPRDRGAQEAIHYPSLVVEVLSPTTEARDRGKKSLLYRSCPTIQEYLLVNAESPIIV